MKPLTYASLFSGAGGFDIGLDRAGLECRFQCEIDPQASKVLFRHWPDVPKHTDVRQVKKKHAPRVNLVVGGFPCQDLSVAGKREGLKGERSGLFYELLRVATMCNPEFVLWENVPGLLSSDDGRDFARVLRGLADIGYFGAWRVLDARFFGVPQRRRRVFGLFARGRSGAVRCAEILALTKGVCGDSATGREAGQDVAFTLTSSVGRNSGGTRVGNAWNTNYVAARCQTSSGYRSAVRRLTPRECERLMSWPDDHTRYDDAGAEFADGPRYRMCGNGVVSNVAEWIGRRLIEAHTHEADPCQTPTPTTAPTRTRSESASP